LGHRLVRPSACASSNFSHLPTRRLRSPAHCDVGTPVATTRTLRRAIRSRPACDLIGALLTSVYTKGKTGECCSHTPPSTRTHTQQQSRTHAHVTMQTQSALVSAPSQAQRYLPRRCQQRHPSCLSHALSARLERPQCRYSTLSTTHSHLPTKADSTPRPARVFCLSNREAKHNPLTSHDVPPTRS
jgi:hypothetical protein